MTKKWRVIIVKVGSNALVNNQGEVDLSVVETILSETKKFVSDQKKILLVTSGAGKLGKEILGEQNSPINIAAGVGQVKLFSSYHTIANSLSLTLAELLIARPHLSRRDQFLKLQETVNSFFTKGIIPLVNENDALVAGTDWSFGDNDSLAAALAISLHADKLIILSHIDGLFDNDPNENPQAKLIDEVKDINAQILRYCTDTISAGGRGGMLSKLMAMRICTAVGIEGQIINGTIKGNLLKALQGQIVGSTFRVRSSYKKISNRERWLMAAKNSAGSLEIDQGAAMALRQGKSLLAVGVKDVYGQFKKHEIIEIVDQKKQGLAFGIVDYGDQEVKDILKGSERHGKQLIHSDNLIIF